MPNTVKTAPPSLVRPESAPRPPHRPARAVAPPVPTAAPWRLVLPVWAAYLAVVSFVASRHEFFRDEVRALSLATGQPSLAALWRELHIEGHPAIWYLLLRSAAMAAGTPHVLQAVSVAVAAAAVLLVLRYAPFGWPTKLLLVFGGLAMYEYAVMARNYGISMLLLFAWAMAYPSRWRSPWRAGAALFLLANTNAHSAMLAGALLAGWFAEPWLDPAAEVPPVAWRRALAGMALGALGIVVCGLALYPPNTLPTVDAPMARLSLGSGLVDATVLGGQRVRDLFGLETVVNRLPYAIQGVLAPYHEAVAAIVVSAFVVVVTAWLLRHRRSLALTWLLATLGMCVFFTFIYSGATRHQGLLFMLAVSLAWAVLATPRVRSAASGTRTRRLGRAIDGAFRVAFVGALAVGLGASALESAHDVRQPRSSAEAFGRWLRSQPRYANAIVLAEPGYLVEALPYYAPNRLYILREHRFGPWTRFDRSVTPHLSLAELRAGADSVQAATHTPVLVVFGDWLSVHPPAPAAHYSGGFGWTFDVTPQDYDAFLRTTRRVATFKGAYASGENYEVYALEPAAADSAARAPAP